MNRLLELGKEYEELHSKYADGCKSSCTLWKCIIRKYGYNDETTYGFAFGGYCLGECSRWEEIEGETIEEVVEKTKAIFKRVQEYKDYYNSEDYILDIQNKE